MNSRITSATIDGVSFQWIPGISKWIAFFLESLGLYYVF